MCVKLRSLLMFVIVMTFCILFIGCDNRLANDSGTSDPKNSDASDPKTLVIQNMPATVLDYAASGFEVGLFPVGTTPAQALSRTGIVAGVNDSSPGWSYNGNEQVIVTLPLYNINTDSRWIGNGTYDIYGVLSGSIDHYYKASSVNISAATTYISFDTVDEIISF